MIKSIDIGELSQNLTNKKVSVFPFAMCDEAKRLFIHTNERSKTIAYELGFENEAYFSRFFEKKTGFSPREFTKRNVYQNV